MIGIAVGLFMVLLLESGCSIVLKIDFKWWNEIYKPAFLLNSAYITCFVIISYMSSILTMGRLVEHKHIFPSMIFFVLLGIGCFAFIYALFSLKNLLLALINITFVLSISYVLLVRFLIKDIRCAIYFAPTFLFNTYSFICAISLAMSN